MRKILKTPIKLITMGILTDPVFWITVLIAGFVFYKMGTDPKWYNRIMGGSLAIMTLALVLLIIFILGVIATILI